MKPERIEPGPGQESVWDYPRPPRLERTGKRISITFNDVLIVDTRQAWRVLETSHPPVYYVPRVDIRNESFIENPRKSYCEWKGVARYLDVRVDDRIAEAAAWYYPEPTVSFEDGEVVTPQPGGFYGGWITSDIVGPFKA